MNINIDFLKKDLLGCTVPIPVSGTLSGHSAGEPFDKHAFRVIKEHYPENTYRQFEFLNHLYQSNPTVTTLADRALLIGAPALAFLLSRGKDATLTWSASQLFDEKQNDTADILVLKEGFSNILDVKTFNKAKNGQPPNLISAYKLAKMCSLMIGSDRFDSHDITYIGITWEIDGKNLKCVAVDIKQLFKTSPRELYINWAAALQIQFHVANLTQSYKGDVKEWCNEYLENFTKQAESRLTKMQKKFIDPFKNSK